MRSVALLVALWLTIFAAFAAQPIGAQTVVDRAKDDQVTDVPDSDPAMQLALKRARETRSEFLVLVRAPRPTIVTTAVKIAVHEGDVTEYLWLDSLYVQGDHFVGTIDNTPRLVHSVSLGQAIAFQENEIVDWFYVENGKMVGNFTACAMLKREPPDQAEDFKKEFGLTCEP
jgi:uncharacterized protein YegJ (DUF2314 family)